MTLPYAVRLVSVCLAFLCLAHLTASVAVSLSIPSAVNVSRHMQVTRAARFLLALRLLPAGLALLGLATLCIPSYLRFEPEVENEQVGIVCLALSVLGFGMCMVSMLRAMKSLTSRPPVRRRAGRRELVWVIDDPAPVCALFGILRPHVLISRRVLEALSAEELRLALDHERAHLHAADNLKRLLVLMAPRFIGAAVLEREWARFAEFAADDRAAAGQAQRSLALASALVRVARLGSSPRTALATAFIHDGKDLPQRVERLLSDADRFPQSRARRVGWWTAATAVVVMVVVIQPASLQSVHAILERLMH